MLSKISLIWGCLLIAACQTAVGKVQSSPSNSLAKAIKQKIEDKKLIHFAFMFKGKSFIELENQFSEKITQLDNCFIDFFDRSQGSNFQIMGEFKLKKSGKIKALKFNKFEPEDKTFKTCLREKFEATSFAASAESGMVMWTLQTLHMQAKNEADRPMQKGGPPHQVDWPKKGAKIYQ